VGLFRVAKDGRDAERVTVKFGQASVNNIVVVSGLAAGDQVILSDMSNWDAFNKVRLR
jgi:multidrug efflux pump subunit AcrA (membrane-fusion protein)